jgi:hypothetical protein
MATSQGATKVRFVRAAIGNAPKTKIIGFIPERKWFTWPGKRSGDYIYGKVVHEMGKDVARISRKAYLHLWRKVSEYFKNEPFKSVLSETSVSDVSVRSFQFLFVRFVFIFLFAAKMSYINAKYYFYD